MLDVDTDPSLYYFDYDGKRKENLDFFSSFLQYFKDDLRQAYNLLKWVP